MGRGGVSLAVMVGSARCADGTQQRGVSTEVWKFSETKTTIINIHSVAITSSLRAGEILQHQRTANGTK